MGKKTKVGKARKDKFYQLAKETGFRSRAAFKLIQLNRKFGFLQESRVCIDLCAAPGGWMQVAKQNMPVSSIVVGVDLYPIRPIPGCIGLVADITTPQCSTMLTKELQSWKADVILHDGAPNVGKNWLHDAYQQICLTLMALKLSTKFLCAGGWFVTKVFRSKDYNALLWVLKQLFRKVHATKPSASRKESAEIFIVCQSYLAPGHIDSRLLDPKYVFEDLELDAKKSTSLLHPERSKKVKADGYTAADMSMRNELSAIDFMQASNGLAALQGISCINIDAKQIAEHPRTTAEIKECCKDIKVLGRKDIRGLLAWWKAVKTDLYPDESMDASKAAPAKEIEGDSLIVTKQLSQEQIDEMEDQELQQQINDLADEEMRDLKRKRKKTSKAKSKLQEKMNLKMIIKGDDGPREETAEDMFNLNVINTENELNQLLDVSADFEMETDAPEAPKIPKYKSYDKEDKRLDDDANYENDDEPEVSDDEDEEDFSQQGLGLSESDDDNDDDDDGMRSGERKGKRPEHPLLKSGDFRDKDTRRQQRVQLWYEKENLQNIDSEDDEDYDLNYLADEYKSKGVRILGEEEATRKKKNGKDGFSIEPVNSAPALGKKAKRRARHGPLDDESSSSSSSNEEEEQEAEGDGEKQLSAGNLAKDMCKKVRLTEEELALGAMMIKGKKARRDLIDGAWNRYAFNDENLPAWFVQDEQMHMRKEIPVPKELAEEYQAKVQELNVRPIKKVMEAKARKRRRTMRRLAKAKKEAEKIMENADATPQEKVRQLKKIYKKAQDKKKEVTYVVAKKHSTSRRARRPPGVKGRYKMVDPRQKKDKRSMDAKAKREKRGRR